MNSFVRFVFYQINNKPCTDLILSEKKGYFSPKYWKHLKCDKLVHVLTHLLQYRQYTHAWVFQTVLIRESDSSPKNILPHLHFLFLLRAIFALFRLLINANTMRRRSYSVRLYHNLYGHTVSCKALFYTSNLSQHQNELIFYALD